jgi:hypothetical protein
MLADTLIPAISLEFYEPVPVYEDIPVVVMH